MCCIIVNVVEWGIPFKRPLGFSFFFKFLRLDELNFFFFNLISYKLHIEDELY